MNFPARLADTTAESSSSVKPTDDLGVAPCAVVRGGAGIARRTSRSEDNLAASRAEWGIWAV
ncbi:MAG TPA: hypothetical protein VMU61_01235 [Candidatus Aquilonibacter sp.]|nr:hypothetical protein [Candidatus Aquilonibacter sp.]